MKVLLKKGDEPYLHVAPSVQVNSTFQYLLAELLMNRKLRTNVSSFREAQKPCVPNRKLVVER